MTLFIIGAGLGRTGAASLKVAREMLGFGKRHHMSEAFGSPEQIALWPRAAAAKFAGGPGGESLDKANAEQRAALHGGKA